MSEKKELSPEKEQLLQSPLIQSLPDDITVEIVTRVPRSCYPIISLVSKGFKKLVASPELYKRRSLLGCHEHCLYAILRNRSTGDRRLYVLHSKVNSSNRLVVVRSLPIMSSYVPRPSYVPVGSKIYVFNDLDAFKIDCRSHTVQPISDIPQRMSFKVANMVGGKVYVIGDGLFHVDKEGGGWWKWWRKSVSVFDTETQMWEPVTIKQDRFVEVLLSEAVVMENKIYMKGDEDQGTMPTILVMRQAPRTRSGTRDMRESFNLGVASLFNDQNLESITDQLSTLSITEEQAREGLQGDPDSEQVKEPSSTTRIEAYYIQVGAHDQARPRAQAS